MVTLRARSTAPSENLDYSHISHSELHDDSASSDWVDEPSTAPTTSVASRSIPSSPRKRRGKTPSALASGRTPARAHRTSSSRDHSAPGTPPPFPAPNRPLEAERPPLPALTTFDEVATSLVEGTRWTTLYTLSILRPALHLLRIPLALLLVAFLASFVLSRTVSTLSTALAPLCYLPGIWSTPGCRWVHGEQRTEVQWADYPTLVDVQSKTFEQMLDDSVASGRNGGSLALDIKKTEMATADLVALIRLSDLRSRESLAETLSEFIADAKAAGRGLHRLDAKMNGAIDSIMAMNDYALHAIEGAREPRGLWRPGKRTEVVVMETFQEAMNVLSGHLERLILELESNYRTLENLEEKLSTLRDIVAREDKRVTADKEELLSYLWTKLGGNRKDLRNFERNLKMLGELTRHRKEASARVVATLHTLQAVSQDMEDMRERVAAPNLAGSKISAEVHMKSIRNGLERLKEGRSRAKQLEEAALREAIAA